jgi:hypothetical protein
MKKKFVSNGVVAEYNGKYWGELYSDGHSTSNGWVEIDKAKIHNSEFCKKPTDMTYSPQNGYEHEDYRNLKKSTLKGVKITQIFEISD